MVKIKSTLVSALILFASLANAETVYVIDELKIGLHQSASINSPIIKLIKSGTELKIVDRIDDLVEVEDPEGAKGWINQKYVLNSKPGKARISELEKEIESLKSGTLMTENNNAPAEQKELIQQLNSERLKSGDLQAQLADLKAKIANVDSSDQFASTINSLTEENQQLKAQLESSGIEINTTADSTGFSLQSWKQYLIAILVILVIGMAAGAFALDYLNRRRHGGFRV
jgi:SH3 domain protein